MFRLPRLQLLNLWQRLVRARVAPSVLGDGATLAVRSPTAPVIWSWHAGIARSRIIDEGITSHGSPFAYVVSSAVGAAFLHRRAAAGQALIDCFS